MFASNAGCRSVGPAHESAPVEYLVPSMVTVIVPALNEELYIEGCLASLLAQQACNVVQVIVADGGSSDRTVPIVEEISRCDERVRLVHNPDRIQSAGFNLAVKIADERVSVLIRADAHVVYNSDFVALCLAALRDNGATSVVVPMRTIGLAGFQIAVAAAQNSKLGNGGAAHRVAGGSEGWVRHGHHAAFDRAFFEACGGYDVTFSHNEDAELDHRFTLAGGRIWMCTAACVNYFPRKTPQALVLQYLRNGRGRARTQFKHRLWPGMRQIAPVLLLPILIGALLLVPLWPAAAFLPFAYVTGCLLVGLVTAIRRRNVLMLAIGPAAIIMHLSFAVGFLQTLIALGFGDVILRDSSR